VIALLVLSVHILVYLQVAYQTFLNFRRLGPIQQLVDQLDMHFLAEIKITFKFTDALFVKASRI
jgi:hypothetical protein